MFNIVIRSDFSLADLSNLHQSGAAVVKTPHIGNIYPNNLAVAQQRIPLLLNDRTIGHKDRNFHPHLLIENKQATVVACDQSLTYHSTFTRRVNGYTIGSSVVDVHTNKLRNIFPQTRIETYTQYQQRHKLIFLSILDILIRDHFQLFERYVDSNGKIEYIKPSCYQAVNIQKIHGLSNLKEGWLIPNILTIFICGICEAVDFNTHETYHLSGPDMVRYIGKLQPALNSLYNQVKLHSSLELPDSLDYYLIPASEMRLAVHKSRKNILDNLMSAYLDMTSYEQLRRMSMRTASSEQRKIMLTKIMKARKSDKRHLTEAVKMCPDIFYDIASASYLSQHDLSSASDLYVHPWGINTPIDNVQSAIRDMKRLLS